MNKFTFVHKKRGVSLLETVVYFALLSVLTSVVTTSLISLFKSYSLVKAQQDIETTAIQIFDKISRDIHNANAVVVASSSFGVPQGAVGLSIASTTSSTTETYMYYVQNGDMKVSRNGTYIGDLSVPPVDVNSFTARYINGTNTQAIKLEMILRASPRYSTTTISKNFYTTVQLRD